MKVHLIYLDTRRGKSHMPTGLAYIAGYLAKAGHEIEVMACETFHYDSGHILKRIYESQADVFGITAMYPEINLAKEMTENIRVIKKNATVILGGFLPTSIPEFSLKTTGVDVCVKGEGEVTITKVVKCLESGKSSLGDIPGIVFKDGSEIIDTGPGEFISDLDNLDLPMYKAFPLERLMHQHFYPADEGAIVADMSTSRGCPFSCNFCYNYSKPRYRSIESVVEELKYLKKKFNINAVNFLDNTFVISKKRMIRYFECIKKANLDIKFMATARAAIIDEELAEILYEAGARCINIGLESGDPQMLERIKKKTSVEQMKYAIETLRKVGIFVEYPCMVGNIGETEESMKNTYKILKDLAWGDFQSRIPFYCTPYPGTDIYKYAIQKGIISGIEEFYTKHTGSTGSYTINLTAMPIGEFLKLNEELIQDLKRHYMTQLAKWKPSYTYANNLV